MALLDDILAWSSQDEFPDWQSDALRRVFATNGKLSHDDMRDIRAMVEGAVGAPTPAPLAASHIPTMGSGISTLLLGLSRLDQVNGFPNGRKLELADHGISVIFGENGAGKSGFARVMKRACRARHSAPVLANAFADTAHVDPPQASIAYRVDGKKYETTWAEGDASNADLAMVSVYDSHCAHDYVSKNGALTFVPYGFSALEALAVAQQAIQEQIGIEIRSIPSATDQFASLKGTHSVGRIVADLGADTDITSLEALASLSPEEADSIPALHAAIKGMDIESDARKHEQLALRLEMLAKSAAHAEELVADSAVDTFLEISQAAEAALEADRIAQGLLRAAPRGNALLPQTGGREWKLLFHAAEAFSRKAYPRNGFHPATEPDSQCVLCQQTLDKDAQARMIGFREFISADAARNLEAASSTLIKARQKLDTAVLCPVDDPTLGEINQSDKALADAVIAHQSAWNARRNWIISAFTQLSSAGARPCLPTGNTLSSRFVEKAQALRRLVATLRNSTEQFEHKMLSEQLGELTSRRELGAYLPAIRKHIEHCKRRRALEAAHDALNTKSISAKITTLTKIHTTEALAKALNEELEALGYRHRVKPVITSQTKGGRNVHGLGLYGSNLEPQDVLSEGEQRAVAFAFFLAEARLRGDRSTIVFDDPSTSLDHLHRRRMARHLVQFSKTRPVVVLTHDAVFLTAMLREVEEQQGTAKVQTVQWADGHPGGVIDGLAWENKVYAEQMKELKLTAARLSAAPNPYPNDEEKRAIRDAYAHMRGMIERAIREVVLNDTIHPFSDEVRVVRVGAIAGFKIDDWRRLVEIYGKASEVIVAHDSPISGQYEVPSPKEFELDLSGVDAVMDTCVIRRKAFNSTEMQFAIDRRNKARKT